MARITLVVRSAPLTNTAGAPQVIDANADWEVYNILGKKIIDSEV
jgi:hypothetical protein